MNNFNYISYPLKAYPLRGFLAITIILVVVIVSWILTQYIILPILSFLICTMPVIGFLLPTKFAFKENELVKILFFYEQKFSWHEFDFFNKGDDGILLMRKNKKYEYIYIFNDQDEKAIINFLNDRGINAGT